MTRYVIALAMIFLMVPMAQAHKVEKPGVVHVVVGWLKEPGNTEHRERLIEVTRQLKEIPGVLDLKVGRVIPSDRPVVDSSYDIAIYLRFASVEDLQAYLVHPTHQRALKESYGPLMDRYRVYDFTDE